MDKRVQKGEISIIVYEDDFIFKNQSVLRCWKKENTQGGLEFYFSLNII
jgi:hypothetical protein